MSPKGRKDTPVPVMRRGFRSREMPVEKAKDVRNTVRRLWLYFGGQRWALASLAVLVVLGSLVGLTIPYLIGRAVDTIEALNGGLRPLSVVVFVLLIAYLVEALTSFGQNYVMAGVSQHVVLVLRRSVFAKLQTLPLSFFDQHTHGEIMSRIANDLDNVSSTVAQSAVHLMASLLTLGGSFIMMVMLSPALTVASLVTTPLVYAAGRAVTTQTRRLYRSQQAALGKLNGHVEEMVSGLLEVKAFNREKEAVESFAEINRALQDVGIRADIWSGFLMPIMNVISNLGFTAVAAVGGVLAVKGLITVGVIASFLSYSRQFVRPLNEVASIYNGLQSALASAERVFEIIDEEEEPGDEECAIELVNPSGEITFKDVSFAYIDRKTVLHDVSFHVPAGSSLAIVGATGSGKTTIINLLTRYYDVQQGQILVDGLDIRSYTKTSLRKNLGVVLQDTYLFAGTIADNIRYGRLDAGIEEVVQAAKLARADGFIRRLPKGYDTELSESGSSLSHGQRQLLAIARAILADPSILILDEATSSVDTRTELGIQEALRALMKGRTSIIVAHRLSTIRDADQILLLDQGRVVEVGTHQELLAKQGAYYRLYTSQFSEVG